MTKEYLGIVICLDNLAVSQYCNYKFRSMCSFGSRYIAAGEDGIFVLDNSEKDDEDYIESMIELPLTDLGIPNQKRLRSIYIGYETTGSLKLIVSDDEGNEREYSLSSTVNSQHGGKVSVNRDGKGRYWSIRLENVKGCDFSVDSIEVIPVILGRKPSGS